MLVQETTLYRSLVYENCRNAEAGWVVTGSQCPCQLGIGLGWILSVAVLQTPLYQMIYIVCLLLNPYFQPWYLQRFIISSGTERFILS